MNRCYRRLLLRHRFCINMETDTNTINELEKETAPVQEPHASAQTDHPVRQSLWGWGEVFIDTFIICVIFYNIEADLLWAFTDILSAVYVLITIFIIAAKHKEIFRLFDDFWNRYLPDKERGENPPYVSFDCHQEE